MRLLVAAKSLNVGIVPSTTRIMLGSTGSALVEIATGLFALAFLVALFRLMTHAHNPRRRQQDMQWLADASVALVLLFGITTVVGILVSVYLHA